MKVSALGQFALIDRIERLIAERGLAEPRAGSIRFPLLAGIGADTAAWQTSPAIELYKTDSMVEGVHFTRGTASWRDVGWKAMVANQSDMAAMGGLPLYALVTLGLPLDTEIEHVDELYGGLLDACAAQGGAIVGGGIVRSPVVFITIALTGATPGPLLLRNAAKADDLIAVTGKLGGSAAGLRMLTEGLRLDAKLAHVLQEAHLRRTPRLAEGRVLATHGVRCAMDISDGLADDLGKLCKASKVAAVLRAADIPVDPAVTAAFPGEETALALASGEEYELIFTAPAKTMSSVLPLLPAGGTVVGAVIEGPPGNVRLEDASGRPLSINQKGWDHFRT